ncbi:hypothetical protein CO60_3171 [Mycobacterium tuberculosis]|nr:hypothetical protein CO60_3171 [Mycobacterium tuberculosis]
MPARSASAAWRVDTSTAAGRWAKKGANHFDVRLADQALALGGGGGGQLWG